MKVLITGASSGIGREMARVLAPKSEKLILVGRDVGRLQALEKELSPLCPGEVAGVACDISVTENCVDLHRRFPDVDLLINNAGFGDFGEFSGTSLEKDLSMIDTNIKGLHTLMKLYLRDMVRRDQGQILNVASIAGFAPGPLMATYYATKGYVVRLSEAVRRELRARRSRVRISVLCPGPVRTGFEKTANIGFAFHGADARKVARYALSHLDRFYIVPTAPIRAARLLLSPLPSSLAAEIIYRIQSARRG